LLVRTIHRRPAPTNQEARSVGFAQGIERIDADQHKPPAFLLYVDQGQELYVRAEARQRFSEVIAQGVADPRLYMLISRNKREFAASRGARSSNANADGSSILSTPLR
jgi:hypothetical protein